MYKKDNAGSNALTFAFNCQTSCGGEETITLANYDSYWNDGEWMFFRITWNDNPALSLANQMKIFINGAEPTHCLLYTSGNSAALTHAADIDLDEVRIYERALSLNEIIKSSATEINRNDPGLIGYWRMNITNSADQTFYDYSYQGQHGTRGLDFNPNAHDPSLVTGNVKYRVNDIYKYNNKIYMSTTNPVKDVVVYNLDTSTHNILDLGIGSNDDTQGVVIASDTRGYAIQDNSVVQFDPSDLTIDDSKNLSTCLLYTSRCV